MSETHDQGPLSVKEGFIPRCPICGHQEWEVRGPMKPVEGTPFEEAVVGFQGGQLMAVKVRHFFCTNCGFVRSHALDKLQEG